MAKWVDWSDPQTKHTSEKFMNNIERIMLGRPIEEEQSNPFVLARPPIGIGDKVSFDASQVQFEGKFVPRKYFGVVTAMDELNGLGEFQITAMEDTDDFTMLISADGGISESVMPPYGIGDLMPVFMNLLIKEE